MKNNKAVSSPVTSGLYITATPIGNLGDLSNRAIKILKEVDYIICENPKHSLKLLNNFGIKKRLLSLHDYNEEKIIKIVSKNVKNSAIALISDAGSPLVSDPGYKLVRYFLDNNLKVITIPGSSSIISALQLSGLQINNFAFYGFAPKQKIKRKKYFSRIREINLTSVFFVSAKNFQSAMLDVSELFGEQKIAVCKEITKLNEKVFRGSVAAINKLLKEQKIPLKGEFTIVIEALTYSKPKKVNNKVEFELRRLLKKFNLTEAVKIVHNLTGISRKEIYQTAIRMKNG